MEVELKKNPGRAKVYYLKAMLPRVEAAVRKQQRAVLLAGVMFLTNLGGEGKEFINNTVRGLAFSGKGPITLHSFSIVCSIMITLGEESGKWGDAGGQTKDNPVLDDRLYNALRTFLCTYRESNAVETEICDHIDDLFIRCYMVRTQLITLLELG